MCYRQITVSKGEHKGRHYMKSALYVYCGMPKSSKAKNQAYSFSSHFYIMLFEGIRRFHIEMLSKSCSGKLFN